MQMANGYSEEMKGYINNIKLNSDIECGADWDIACLKCGRCIHEGIDVYTGQEEFGAACEDCIKGFYA